MLSFLFRRVRFYKWDIAVITIIWFLLALLAAIAQLLRYSYNNYLIFKGVFWHLLLQSNLFIEYPQEYLDTNHYGPTFALLIAPFAVLPDWLGMLLWALANAAFLFYAIKKLPISERNRLVVLAIGAVEMMTATHNLQFNTMLTAWLVLAFILVEKEKDFWATLFIAAGFLVKIYGIAGVLFFCFSRHKVTFIWSFLFWLGVLFSLPMLLSSAQFVFQSYEDWYRSLLEKDAKNADFVASGGMQDISVMGMIRRISKRPIDGWYVLVPAALLVLTPLLRFRQYVQEHFRLSYLAIVLISVVIFSSSAESATYVIAMSGVGVWYIINKEECPKATSWLLLFALLFTSLSPTDLFPSYVRTHVVRAYSLKALPCFLVWLWLIKQVSLKESSKPLYKFKMA